MTVFCHHIYEYKKGLRNLVLHTLPATARPGVERKLTTCGIDYLIHPLGEKRINVFFGAAECVDVVRRIDKPLLRDYTPEEDFMLGIMLGYDRLRQCGRFLERCGREKAGIMQDFPTFGRDGARPSKTTRKPPNMQLEGRPPCRPRETLQTVPTFETTVAVLENAV